MNRKLTNRLFSIVQSPARRRLAVFLLLGTLVAAFSVDARPAAPADAQLTVAVTRWRHDGGPELDIQQRTYANLTGRLNALSLEGVQVIMIPAELQNADDVDRVAARYGVDMLVWGWYDESGVRGYVDLADAAGPDGLSNSLDAFLKRGGSTLAIRVLQTLADFDYYEEGVYFCVPRWNP